MKQADPLSEPVRAWAARLACLELPGTIDYGTDQSCVARGGGAMELSLPDANCAASKQRNPNKQQLFYHQLGSKRNCHNAIAALNLY